MKNRLKNTIDIIRSLFKSLYLIDNKISYYNVYKIFIKKLAEDEIFERSLAVAFSFTIATFPLIIFLPIKEVRFGYITPYSLSMVF